MYSNRFLPYLLAVTLLLGDLCALRFAQDHFWPEMPTLFVMALFTSQLALLTTAAVLYRGLLVLRIAAAVCVAVIWCRWGSSLVGGMQDWTAMATMVALPLAAALLVARSLTARQQQRALAKATISNSALGVGELFTAIAVVAMVFATIRAGIDSPLTHPTLILALVASLYSIAFAVTILSSPLKATHLVLLVPLGVVAGLALKSAGGWPLETTLLWSGLHGLLLTTSLCILRASGLRIGLPEHTSRTPAYGDALPQQNSLARA